MITNFSTSSVRTGLKRKRFWDQSAVANSFFSIATVTVGAGGAANVTFSNIPQNYTHLQLRVISWTNDTANSGLGNVRMSGFFNADETASNYYSHILLGDGASVSAVAEQSAKFMSDSVRNSMIAPGCFIADILDYRDTNKFKTIKTLSGYNNNDTSYGGVRIYSGLWRNTSAITSIKIVPESGSLKQHSSFALYGVLA